MNNRLIEEKQNIFCTFVSLKKAEKTVLFAINRTRTH